MKIYLSGAMTGLSDEEQTGWRKRAKQLLPDYEFFDPTETVYPPDVKPEDIVGFDLDQLWKSDAVLVNCSPASWGTAMELFYAREELIVPEIIGFNLPPEPSPWLVYCLDETFRTLEEAAEYLKRRAEEWVAN